MFYLSSSCLVTIYVHSPVAKHLSVDRSLSHCGDCHLHDDDGAKVVVGAAHHVLMEFLSNY